MNMGGDTVLIELEIILSSWRLCIVTDLSNKLLGVAEEKQT